MINLEKVCEGIHYELIPASAENEMAWDIRILEGDYVETVIRYGKIAFNGKTNHLTFDFKIISSPDSELTVANVHLQDYCAEILEDIIQNAIVNDTLVTQDKEQE